MYRRLRCHRIGRRWSSSAKPKSSSNEDPHVAHSSITSHSRSSTPGIVRVTKSDGADKHEAELDSTIARIIGSDWGDRSHQPVSLPMRIYWIIFAVVLGNGLYTYFAGKDESFLVEKLKKKADAKFGVQQENEYVDMEAEEKEKNSNAVQMVSAQSNEDKVATKQPTTLLPSTVMSGMPFIAPGMASQPTKSRPKSKTELEQQLAHLRVQQERLQQQIRTMEGVMKAELEHQVRMVDVQKEQVKQMIKRL